jgi:hypothetical protein
MYLLSRLVLYLPELRAWLIAVSRKGNVISDSSLCDVCDMHLSAARLLTEGD